MGSTETVDAEELTETAWGLIDNKQLFLGVIRLNSVRGSEWTECLPSELMNMIETREYIVKWTPQKEILAHFAIGAFLSHCGWNSTLEGIIHGVPAPYRPAIIDQRVNARYLISEWQVGIELKNAQDRTIRRRYGECWLMKMVRRRERDLLGLEKSSSSVCKRVAVLMNQWEN